MSETKRTVAVVDDHPIVLDGLINLLNSEKAFKVSGRFTTGRQLLDFLQDNQPEIILLDIALPDINGMDLFDKIRALSPGIVVLVFSNHNEPSAVLRMLEGGVQGYILKSTPPQEIIHCIKEALEGRLALSGEVQSILEAQKRQVLTTQTIRLSAREKEIVALIAAGNTTAQIAKTLFLSKFTIENHRKNILQKLQVKNVAELIAEAVKRELI
ncbi:response regulator transcription factor [Arachidicoccus terrestris]|uniref:response regulator transcription factor n=1 Tax=Arachidicoccus terrestris TaxID=2875539 RepID=UPI001CC3B485|nr:response regulator transcription factor [Arachidicoccus terrestris]UAY54231.1 response regulator transcription factor [Arachidicoccus terrestris]